MQQTTYLLMVSPNGNMGHNKYYKMIPHGNTWTAEYGRVGANPQKMAYPMSTWDKKYNEKLCKGYVDRSDLHQEVVITMIDNGYKDIDDASVSTIVARLQEWANMTINRSYKVSSKEVTEAMVHKAQQIIDKLSQSPTNFNELLIELFTVIPRKMSSVQDSLAKSIDDYEKILRREQDLLDVMKGQVGVRTITSKNKKPVKDITILEAMGMKIRHCTSEEIAQIKKHMDDSTAVLVKDAWRVNNNETDEKFNAYCKKKHIKNFKFYYHGSRNENIWSIITQGMSLHPNAKITGKMFGMGLYFAPKAGKSRNYTSLESIHSWVAGDSDTGLMAIFKVAEGKALDVYYHENKYLNYTENDILRQNCDSLFAHKGTGSRYDSYGRRTLLNDEVIVYNEAAATIQYLVELRK